MYSPVNVEDYFIRIAKENDLDILKSVLARNNQNRNIVLNDRTLYYVAEIAGEIIGLAGAEYSGGSGLIRSTAVLAPHRGKGVAKKLVNRLFDDLEGKDIRRLYLFSRDTGSFWENFGFISCSVQTVIDHLPDAHQVLCYIADKSIWTDVAWKRDTHTINR